jgi:hypothetical protein
MNGQKMTAALLAAAVALASALAAPQPDPKKATPEDIDKAAAAVKAYLANVKGDYGVVTHIKDDAVEKALPGKIFFAVLFRQYPVGRPAPQGLSASNVFVVDGQGKATPLPNAAALQKYLKESVAPVKDDAAAKDAAHACARLGQELVQDGFYKFQIMDDAIKVEPGKGGGRTAAAKTVVMQGGNGEIGLVAKFDDAGKLTDLEESVKVRPGPRPICQATLLLNADPLVRRICEQDLLVMGTAALPYLAEQRAKASLELQKEIDRVVKRIEAGER